MITYRLFVVSSSLFPFFVTLASAIGETQGPDFPPFLSFGPSTVAQAVTSSSVSGYTSIQGRLPRSEPLLTFRNLSIQGHGFI